MASMAELSGSKIGGARVGSVAIALLIGTAVQQWFIYRDIHLIEESPEEVARDYPKWLNMRIEIILRVLIVLFLLFGVGKIAEDFYPIAQRIQVEPVRQAVMNFLHPPPNSVDFSRNFFVKGSAAVFLLLFIWNFFALMFRFTNWPKTSAARELARELVVTLRILIFCLLSGLYAIFWWLVLLRNTWTLDAAQLMFGVYLIAVIFIGLLRLTWLRQRLERLTTRGLVFLKTRMSDKG